MQQRHPEKAELTARQPHFSPMATSYQRQEARQKRWGASLFPPYYYYYYCYYYSYYSQEMEGYSPYYSDLHSHYC